jgi:RNA polymerase sigma-70 factor, ECF subfamily
MTASDEEFASFVDEISADLLRATMRLAPAGVEADDLAAEALARAYVRWDKLASAAYRRAWVFKVVANLALSAHSSGRRHALSMRRWTVNEAAAQHAETGSPEREATDDAMLRSLLRRLPARQKQAVALHFVADLSLEETAQVMGVSRETVKTHVERGLSALRKALGPTSEVLFRD